MADTLIKYTNEIIKPFAFLIGKFIYAERVIRELKKKGKTSIINTIVYWLKEGNASEDALNIALVYTIKGGSIFGLRSYYNLVSNHVNVCSSQYDLYPCVETRRNLGAAKAKLGDVLYLNGFASGYKEHDAFVMFDEAHKLFSENYRILPSHENRLLLAFIYERIANSGYVEIEENIGNYASTQKAFEVSVNLLITDYNHFHRPSTLYYISYVYYEYGLKLFVMGTEKKEDEKLKASYSMLCNAFSYAEQYYKENPSSAVRSLLINIVTAIVKRREYICEIMDYYNIINILDKTKVIVKESYKKKPDIESRRDFAITNFYLGKLHNDLNNSVMAVDYYNKSIELFKKCYEEQHLGVDSTYLHKVSDELIEIYQKLGNNKEIKELEEMIRRIDNEE